MWDISSASGLTVTTMTVSPTKREPPFGAGTPGGGFLFLGMVNLTFGIPDLSIPDSPQKSSAVRKVYRRPLRLLRRHLSQRERPWQAGPLPTGRLRPDMAQKGGPCYRGQQLLDNAPCQAAAALDSGALPFPRHRALLVQTKPDRHANGSPFGGAGAERLRGQGRCQTALTQR